ncbi:MFS transporter [Nonomuraea jiangxiensis]|uniref:MFS-type transporter involved in bile tolerance, Atg22 family n=1 Tax=Nonomuraea jiangxiensis TaxID=633440 RepID=A0A1G8I177_9ACTN|nr:MFS transporter [Nonomuraea jiangxiensis]SDI12597.1 MFS-type transporter involved in bile tolerance, Atg22 family [Nonomuraea jiangxiensis]
MAGLGRSFGFLCSSTALSNLADGVLKIGAPLLAVSMTRSPLLVSLVGAATTVPWLLFALHAGAIADRADRRRIMVLAHSARAAILVGVALLAALGMLDLWLLLAAVLLVGVSEVFADLSAQSILPMTVPREHLTRANGRVSTVQLIGNDFLGAPLAGLLVAALPAVVFGAPALLYGVAAILLLGMRGTFALPTTAHPTGNAPAIDARTGGGELRTRRRRTLVADIGEALRYLWSHSVLRSMAIAAGLLNLAGSAYLAVFVLWAVGDESMIGLEPSQYGLMMTAFAAGAVIGSLLSGRAAGIFGEFRTILGGWLIGSLLYLVPVIVPSPWALYPTVVLWGVTGAGANVLVISARQRLIPAQLLGRVNSAYRLVGMGGMPLGAALAGVLAEFVGLAAVLAGATGVCLAAVGLVWRGLWKQISRPLTSEPALSDISRSR